MMPKVSVCIPTYNYARYLPEAIQSVLSQTYQDFELIIIDNHSKDGSVDVITKYASCDQRILFKVNENTIGMVNNWNLCLQQARGMYIKYLFADDVLSSVSTLQRMIDMLDANPNISLVASARSIIDDQSRIIDILVEYEQGFYPGSQIIQECLLEQKNRIGEPSVAMFRKRQAERGFDPRYRQIADLEMWFHLLEQGDLAYLMEPLCSFRNHATQQTKVNTARYIKLDESLQLLNDYRHKPYITISGLRREYMFYVPAYATWKLYKKKHINKREALERIGKHYKVIKFFALYPLYKLIKFCQRIVNPMRMKIRKRAITSRNK